MRCRTAVVSFFVKMVTGLTLSALVLSAPALGDDWPMWRNDAGRTGVSLAELPDELSLKWVRHLPQLSPAFHNPRLQFDAGYEPIVAGGKLLVSSSLTDSVTAWDAKTGAEAWVFRTNGPVRFAAAIWKDNVCFGSDDCCLYCVGLNDGKLRWKHRAVPSERRLLGNQRLISVWPVRGGPVVADGRVYFAAGVWPFEGVFVTALDVKDGTKIWRNERLGYLFGRQPHNTEAIGGLAPQGYLVVNEKELIVPCSTAYPARLNRETGELIEFALPSPGRLPGGWFAAMDETSAKAIRRGKLAFDDVINRQLHEDKVHKGHGVSGLARRIRVGQTLLEFDKAFDGVDGEIHSMIAAENRLYVTTVDGRLFCFADTADSGDGGSQKAKVKHWRSAVVELKNSVAVDDFVTQLLEIAASNDVPDVSGNTVLPAASSAARHGYAFVIGLQDGAVVKALLKNSQCHVIAIDDDAALVDRLRVDLDAAGVYGTRAAVIECDLASLDLPPYLANVITTETPDRMANLWGPVLQTLRPFGGVAALRVSSNGNKRDDAAVALLSALPREGFQWSDQTGQTVVRRLGPLAGSTDYKGDWQPSEDELVRFPLGVLWFDDTLAHFKRSPQPKFSDGVMISQGKDWHAPRIKGNYKVDYPLMPHVLSDIYTGRVFTTSEYSGVRASLPESDVTKREPSQYRPPKQKDAWKPGLPVAGERTNPLTGETEPRMFPKTYGCDGGFDYGLFYTLRSGTPAFYDKTLESGTVFLSGPRSGCTNSIIPSGGVLNVPYFFEGCTCSYPLPTAFSLVSMPDSHEQWSAWGETEMKPKSIKRIGLNFGAPGDRMTRDGTLWLDYPSVGGPSPKVHVTTSPASPGILYRHSLWMNASDEQPWVYASMMEGLDELVLEGLKPGSYTVKLYFAEPKAETVGARIQTVSLQSRVVLKDLDIRSEAAALMTGMMHEVKDVKVDDRLTLNLTASQGRTIISGLEVLRDAD